MDNLFLSNLFWYGEILICDCFVEIIGVDVVFLIKELKDYAVNVVIIYV